jgi:hypothetical protein
MLLDSLFRYLGSYGARTQAVARNRAHRGLNHPNEARPKRGIYHSPLTTHRSLLHAESYRNRTSELFSLWNLSPAVTLNPHERCDTNPERH